MMLVPGWGPGIACPHLSGFMQLHTETATLEPAGPESQMGSVGAGVPGYLLGWHYSLDWKWGGGST